MVGGWVVAAALPVRNIYAVLAVCPSDLRHLHLPGGPDAQFHPREGSAGELDRTQGGVGGQPERRLRFWHSLAQASHSGGVQPLEHIPNRRAFSVCVWTAKCLYTGEVWR